MGTGQGWGGSTGEGQAQAPALGMVWHNEQQQLNPPTQIPAPTEPVPGLLPLLLLPGLEYAPRQGNFGVQCRASSSNSQTLNYCKVVVGEMQPETFPVHVFQFISVSGSTVFFYPWLWNKENVF